MFVEEAGLMSYGMDHLAFGQRVAGIVGQTLKRMFPRWQMVFLPRINDHLVIRSTTQTVK
jgi:hypothetical protein